MHVLVTLRSSLESSNPTRPEPLRGVGKGHLKRWLGSFETIKVTEDIGSYSISTLVYSVLHSELHHV